MPNDQRRPGRRRRVRQISPTRVEIDVSDVPSTGPIPLRAWREDGTDNAKPGSFAARVQARRVDLVAMIKDGIPPREYHVRSEGMFVRGKRHLIPAPAKRGKSLVMLTHFTRMSLAGEHIVILDRENGADVYAERLEAIMGAWQLADERREIVGQRLSYYEFPLLKRGDAGELVRWLQDLGADLVCFDSQRMFLTDYGLSESDTDDYATFMAYAIDPLHRAGITTVILDNTGHSDTDRARGTSSKGDLRDRARRAGRGRQARYQADGPTSTPRR